MKHSVILQGCIYTLSWNILACLMVIIVHCTGIFHHVVWRYLYTGPEHFVYSYLKTRLEHSVILYGGIYTLGNNILACCMVYLYTGLKYSIVLYGCMYTLDYNIPSFCMVVSIHCAEIFCHFAW